jgi:hypothetical protein
LRIQLFHQAVQLLLLEAVGFPQRDRTLGAMQFENGFGRRSAHKAHSVYLTRDRHELFVGLSKQTRIAQAVLLREAVDDLLKKYRLLKDEKQTE